MKNPLPDIEIFEHCECSDLEPARLLLLVQKALPFCLAQPGTESPVLSKLDRVEINIVSDATIAEIHDEFMEDPTPTDVITFHHGEIFVSADTARHTAAEHELSAREETLLYMIHGLLHLNGHVDADPADRAEMHRIQDAVLTTVLP